MNFFLNIICLVLLVFSCSSAEKHRVSITKLATTWETTTVSLTDFKQKIRDEVPHWQSMFEGMYADSSNAKKLSPAVLTQMDALKQQCLGHGTIYKNLEQQVNAFAVDWQAQTEIVNHLKTSLEAGKLSDAQVTQIQPLYQKIEATNKNLESWKQEMQHTKDACFETCRQYAQLAKTN